MDFRLVGGQGAFLRRRLIARLFRRSDESLRNLKVASVSRCKKGWRAFFVQQVLTRRLEASIQLLLYFLHCPSAVCYVRTISICAIERVFSRTR